MIPRAWQVNGVRFDRRADARRYVAALKAQGIKARMFPLF